MQKQVNQHPPKDGLSATEGYLGPQRALDIMYTAMVRERRELMSRLGKLDQLICVASRSASVEVMEAESE